MKSRKALMVSLLMGFFSVIMVHLYINKKEADLQANVEPREVFFATEDIPELVRVEVSMVEKRSIPAGFVQPQAADSLDQLIGSVARVPIFKGSQITRNVLLSRTETGLALRVDPLRRALTIAVSDTTGLADLVQPGNRVDLYGTFKIKQRDSETVMTHLLESNVKVLAVERKVGAVSEEEILTKQEYEQLEQQGDRGAGNGRKEWPENMTVSVTSQQAIRLITAQEAGFITAVLRPQFDEASEEQLAPVSTQDLIGKEKETVPQRVPRYEQIRGSEISY